MVNRPGCASPRQCASNPCDRFLLRTHSRRQWCSERCGARQRASRAYVRKHDKTSSSDQTNCRAKSRTGRAARAGGVTSPGVSGDAWLGCGKRVQRASPPA
ncbi:CGNR zinc finger domain-containing protein [Pseudarthrobacter sp. NPDC057230]|uniref:CGNR zinc finger domain-containing protein n=1 Tax=Pseudarthrobacter sp. NPDC057230 TaxID=3346057 RepID=UPI003641EA25